MRSELEPLTDFRRDDARQAMQAALKDVAALLGRTYPAVIGGKPVPATATLDSVNPSHKSQVVGKFARPGVAQAKQAVAAAKAAFPAWRDTAPEDRAELLFRAAKLMQRRRFQHAAWQVYECGKPWREADADVAEAIDYCNFYGREMLRLAEPRLRNVPGEENSYFYEPRGVVVTIAPWNFPLAILCGMTTAALVTGNTVVMKPAEQSAVVGAKLMEVFQEAGFPPGVVNFLPGVGEEIGPALVTHPDVSLIAFTGSRGVGLAINRAGSRHLGRAGPHQARHRRAGRQERDHRRRRRRPGRGDPRHRLERVRLRGPEVLGVQPGDRAGAAVQRIPGSAGRGDEKPERPARGGLRAAASARSSTPTPTAASSTRLSERSRKRSWRTPATSERWPTRAITSPRTSSPMSTRSRRWRRKRSSARSWRC